jgi:hypothetical protein
MPSLVLSLLLILSPSGHQQSPSKGNDAARQSEISRQSAPAQRQLFAVRGQIISVKSQGKGMLIIAIRPVKEFAEVSVIARENDLVGKAVGGASDRDLFGLLTGDASEDETVTAAELGEGDTVSVIYDPQLQNRVIEIYMH